MKGVQPYLEADTKAKLITQKINNKNVEMMNISIPSLIEQEKIVLYLNEVSAEIEQFKSAQQQKCKTYLI